MLAGPVWADERDAETDRPEVFIPSGCAMLVKREAFFEAGGFDESFFCYRAYYSYRKAWAGEGVAPYKLFGQAKKFAYLAYFVFE